MRELREALHEGPHEFLDSLAHFPKRHPLWISFTIVGLLAAYFVATGVLEGKEARREVNVLKPQITQIRRGDPCVSLAQTSPEKTKQVQVLTTRCIAFLDGIAPLVSTKLACAIVEKGGYRCLALPEESQNAPSKSTESHGGDADQTPSTGHQQPGPSGGQPSNPGVSNPPQSSPPSHIPESGTPAPQPQPSPVSEPVNKPPLAPVVESLTPPAAGPAVEHACQHAAAVAAVC